jgi:hypothetical protein
MSNVGAGFGAFQIARQPVRMTPNPMDKCTIVSIYPQEIRVNKPTIFPGDFVIPAAKPDDYALLVVGPSSWWREIDESQPLLEIPVTSFQVAESIVKDYVNSVMGSNSGDRIPGLMFIPGEYTRETIKNYKEMRDGKPTGRVFDTLLAEIRAKQKRWFEEVIKISDVLWARTNGNPLAISNVARMGAEMLGLDKPWMQDFKTLQMENCVACGSLLNPKYPICPTCKAVNNVELAKKLDIKFAS